MQPSITSLIKRLWHHISPRRRVQFGLLLVLMVLASFAEVLSIGAVLPFLGILTAPKRIFELQAAQPVIQALGLIKPEQLLVPLTLAFSLAVLISGSMRLLLLWATTRLSFSCGADLSSGIYRSTLYQPYAVHCARNSSEVISVISGKTNIVIYNIIMPALTLLSSSIMLTAILIALLIVNPGIALATFGGFGVIYTSVIYLTRNRLLINGQINSRESTQVIKSLQEGLGGIRDVLLDGTQSKYCEVYSRADLSLRRAQGSNMFISASPRYAMEALGMILIAVMAYSLAKQVDGISKAIPILGALALGAQRLLPVLQQVYSSLTVIKGNQISLQDTLQLLEQPLPDYINEPISQPLAFMHNICLKKVDFRYSSETPYVLNQLDLNILKGSCVGFIGTTGSGKSTLLDIIMGLLQPTKGSLNIDGQKIDSSNQRLWQAHIAHVPQTIFLADSSIEENIAFGVSSDQIDKLRVREAARKAQIAGDIESWADQYKTFVGERGVRLSGGQRQRIGIARALYKQADVIIFDEATSALDNETEVSVMQAIEGLSEDLTVLIIAHRLTTLKNCSMIVELSEGEIKRTGSYDAMVKQPKTSSKEDKS